MKITIENKENQHIYTAELPEGVSLDEVLDKVYLLLLLQNYYPTKSAIEKSAEELNETMRMLHEEEEE